MSRKTQLPLNHTVNAGLREYVEWGAIYRNIGFGVTGKRFIRELFDNLSDNKARELGRRNGRQEAPQLVISWYQIFNLKNVLRLLGEVLARYNGLFVFEHSQEGRIHTAVVRHEMGSRASAYYGEYVKSICELLNMHCSVTETEAQVIIKAEEPLAGLSEAAHGLPSGLIEEQIEASTP